MTYDCIARREDWETNPLPDKHVVLQVVHVFTSDEMAQIQRGFVPLSMDDKWFIFYEDGWLYCHRSWTGYCIYQARFVEADDGYRVAELRVNRDESQYIQDDDAEDVRRFLQLMSFIQPWDD